MSTGAIFRGLPVRVRPAQPTTAPVISRIPPFVNGVDYVDYPGNEGDWRFQTTRVAAVHIDVTAVGRISFRDGDGVEWARLLPFIDHTALVIAGGYAWDGCSPKRRCGRFYFGTPDFEPTRLASLVHDIGYQFAGAQHWPFTKHEVDVMFLDIMRLGRFPLARAYYGAVDTLAGRAWKVVDPGCHSVLLNHPVAP